MKKNLIAPFVFFLLPLMYFQSCTASNETIAGNLPNSVASVSEIDPVIGHIDGGTKLVVHGLGFTNSARVYIGSEECLPLSFVSSSELRCITPEAQLPAAYNVAVISDINSEAIILKHAFQYTNVEPPEFQENPLTVVKGPAEGGTFLQIFANNLSPQAKIFFGEEECLNSSFNFGANNIACYTPSNIPGKIDVKIINPDGQIDRVSQGFEYEFPVSDKVVQERIFAVSCVRCHAGGSNGIDLSNLDNLSADQRSLNDPNSIYNRVNRAAGSGGVMPPGSKISEEKIEAIRHWVLGTE